MTQPVIEELKSLHTAAIDARNGYEEARHDAEGRGMSPLFQEMIVLHTKNADDLSHVLQRSGERPDDDGSFMSAVHRTIMGVRSLFGGLGESVLPGLIDGEKRNVHQYDCALEAADLQPDIRSLLDANRQRLLGAIAKMEAEKV